MQKKQEYETVLLAVKGLVADRQLPISLYANVSALLKQTLSDVSWVGFYLFNGTALYLGPFQGKVACVDISLDRGVCGLAARSKKTVIVPDVHQFPITLLHVLTFLPRTYLFLLTKVSLYVLLLLILQYTFPYGVYPY
jgi:putative methionine-R-sulfoxide reductase with GAF domain